MGGGAREMVGRTSSGRLLAAVSAAVLMGFALALVMMIAGEQDGYSQAPDALEVLRKHAMARKRGGLALADGGEPLHFGDAKLKLADGGQALRTSKLSLADGGKPLKLAVWPPPVHTSKGGISVANAVSDRAISGASLNQQGFLGRTAGDAGVKPKPKPKPHHKGKKKPYRSWDTWPTASHNLRHGAYYQSGGRTKHHSYNPDYNWPTNTQVSNDDEWSHSSNCGLWGNGC